MELPGRSWWRLSRRNREGRQGSKSRTGIRVGPGDHGVQQGPSWSPRLPQWEPGDKGPGQSRATGAQGRGAGAADRPGPGSLARPLVMCVRAGNGRIGVGALGGRHRKSPRHPHPVPRPCCLPRPLAPVPATTTVAAAFAFATVAAALARAASSVSLTLAGPVTHQGPPGRCGWVGMGTGCLALLASRSSPVLGVQRTLLQRIAQCGARVRAPRLVTVTEAA